MFREMRRFRQALPREACEEILRRRGTGVLAVLGDEDYPYAVPLNFVYLDGRLYFHCACAGHKLDAIARSSKVSFCVIDHDEVLDEKLTTLFRSVIVFGRASIVEDDGEKRAAVTALSRKLAPAQPAERIDQEIAGDWQRLCIVRIDVDHMSGKQCVEYLK